MISYLKEVSFSKRVVKTLKCKHTDSYMDMQSLIVTHTFQVRFDSHNKITI